MPPRRQSLAGRSGCGLAVLQIQREHHDHVQQVDVVSPHRITIAIGV